MNNFQKASWWMLWPKHIWTIECEGFSTIDIVLYTIDCLLTLCSYEWTKTNEWRCGVLVDEQMARANSKNAISTIAHGYCIIKSLFFWSNLVCCIYRINAALCLIHSSTKLSRNDKGWDKGNEVNQTVKFICAIHTHTHTHQNVPSEWARDSW